MPSTSPLSFASLCTRVVVRSVYIRPFALALVTVFTLTSLPGCITERDKPRGIPVLPTGQRPPLSNPTPGITGAAAGASSGISSPAALPSGPVATPNTGRMIATDILVEVQPIGNVPYDGQTLPLLDPAGKFMAVQDGEPPNWPTLLAQPEALPPSSSRIVIFDISTNTPRAIQLAQPLPAGLILGRSADSRGFLVEAPRPGGARWIGKVNWLSGSLTWLVQGDAINAFAIFTPQDELVFTRRRSVRAQSSELVLLSPDGNESVKECLDGFYVYPSCAAAREMIYVLRLTKAATDLEVIRIDRNTSSPRLADTRQSWRIINEPDLYVAAQMASTSSAALLGVTPSFNAGDDPAQVDTLAFFHPGRNRMTRFNAATGGIEALVPRSINAAPSTSPNMVPGYFLTAPKGLVFLPRPIDGAWKPTIEDEDAAARVLAAPYVARAALPSMHTPKSEQRNQKTLEQLIPIYILFGPVKNDPRRIEVTRMAVVPAAAPPPK